MPRANLSCRSYLDPTFVERARTLALIGPPGLGKTMLAICIATKHIQLGATARFITAQHLANQLDRALTSVGRQRVLRPQPRYNGSPGDWGPW